jgi:hypothetical protein
MGHIMLCQVGLGGGGYEPDRTLNLVGDVDLLIKVLVQFIKVFVHILSYIYYNHKVMQ